MAGKGTWYTPIARIKNRQEVWKRIDDHGWKGEKMELSPEMSYFNNVAVHSRILEYDSYMAYTKMFPLWDPRKRKDNTGYLRMIRDNIYEQAIIYVLIV
ncbi:uncharacterized protein LOC143201030 [Rhynchophorus ferrugineus]|uniref:uncharacterized protein LOC143201030 n=1 Tax=Rhynchophorus ferrugineus TaxID=354439 RepID=UPI003FCEC81C